MASMGSRRVWIASLLLTLAAAMGTTSHGAAAAFTDASLEGLVDAKGNALPRNPYPGRHRIVLFGFTSCADVCPLTLLAAKRALDILGARAGKVVPIFISVDPERDTSASLDRYVRAFDARIQGLSGKRDVVDRVAARHGVFLEKRWVNVSSNSYVYDHTASALIIAPDGKLLASVSTSGSTEQVARAIAAAIPAGA